VRHEQLTQKSRPGEEGAHEATKGRNTLSDRQGKKYLGSVHEKREIYREHREKASSKKSGARSGATVLRSESGSPDSKIDFRTLYGKGASGKGEDPALFPGNIRATGQAKSLSPAIRQKPWRLKKSDEHASQAKPGIKIKAGLDCHRKSAHSGGREVRAQIPAGRLNADKKTRAEQPEDEGNDPERGASVNGGKPDAT